MSTHQDLPCLPMETLHRSSNFASLRLLFSFLVGPSGLEPPTLRLSGARSSQLSYGPIFLTRTTSVQEMTFNLASMPCATFYVFGVRTDFGSRVHAVCKVLRLRSFPTHTTSTREMTFSLASMPCAVFYVFGVRTSHYDAHVRG